MILAHGVGSRADLPLPLSYAVTGAVVALAVSFLGLAVLWRAPRLHGGDAGTPAAAGLARVIDGAPLRTALRVLGLALTAYVLVAALAGPDLATNPTAGVVYVLLWVGLVPLSVVFGPVWRLLNPLRPVHALLATITRTDRRDGVLALPPGVGYWPAAIGLFAFVWLELVAPDRATLPVLRTWFALYAGLHLLAALVYGSRWFDRGDAFEVWSGLIGRCSPLGRRDDGRLVWRSPLDGLASIPAGPGLVATVAVVLGSTAYDSMTGAPFWFRFTQRSDVPEEVLGTLALLGLVLLVMLTFTLATMLAGDGAGAGRRALPSEFAHSLLPIAIGYLVAHYYSLLVVEGQQTLINLSDPLVDGSDVLGLSGTEPSTALVDPTAVSVIQVVAIIIGHVLGVVLAHDRAIRLFPRAGAVRGQLPLLILMVGYTAGGLLLLFAS